MAQKYTILVIRCGSDEHPEHSEHSDRNLLNYKEIEHVHRAWSNEHSDEHSDFQNVQMNRLEHAR